MVRHVMSSTVKRSWPFVFGLVLIVACDDGEPRSSGSGTTLVESTAGECIEGELDCPCVDGELCEDGLMCMAGVCAESDNSEDSTGDGTGGVEETGGGVDACADDAECDVTEICVFETCAPVDVFEWEFVVLGFAPNACRDGWGSAEMRVNYYQDDALIWSSPEASCPAGWPDSFQPYTPYSTFRLDFVEVDVLFDDFITSWCWSNSDDGECGSVPFDILHARGFYGFSGDGLHSFEFAFEPIVD